MGCPVGRVNHCEECGYDTTVGVPAGSGFVQRRAPAHACLFPITSQFSPGDVFTCRCGKKYVLGGAAYGEPWWMDMETTR